MFTGLVAGTGTVESLDADRRWQRACACGCRTGAGRRARPGRLGGRQRRVPHGGRARRRRLLGRRDGGDAAAQLARPARRGRHGQPRAAAARRRPPRRPHRAGPRRRHGRVESLRDEGFARVVADRRAGRAAALRGGEGLDRRRRRVPYRFGGGRRRPSRCRSSPRRSSARRSAPPQPGRTVNLEVDVLAKYVEKLQGMTGSALQPGRGGHRGRPRGQDGRGLRRRGPRERGRPHPRRPVRHPEAINFMATHGARPDLPGPDRRALRRRSAST